MRSLYAVQVTHVAMVLADSAFEAANVALEDAYTITFDQEAAIGWAKPIEALEELDQYGWDADSVPYNSGDDQTLRQLINQSSQEK